jgi:hemoglobin/transferrin/lactoferrin receptor protein
MKILYMAALWLFLGLCLHAQTITVIDKTTQERIPGAWIADEQVKVQTNADGQADISALTAGDQLTISLPGYETLKVERASLEAAAFKVALSETSVSLDEVVISANRWEEEQITVPFRVEKLNMRTAAFQNPQTSADLLGSSGYVFIQKSQLAGGSPMIRGFATNRILLVVDGVRMNNAIFRTGNLQNVISLDANDLESAEILFGPGAVMYGSDAIGGVMDFHTLRAKYSDTGKLRFSGNAFGRFSSANTEKTGHVDLNLGLKKLAFATSFTWTDYDDLRTGSNGNSYYLRPTYQATINGVDTILTNPDPQNQIESGYGQLNFMQKIRFKPTENLDLDYAFHYSATTDAPRYDRLTLDANADSILDFAAWYYGPQKWMMNRLGVTLTKSNNVFDRLRIVAAMQNYEESRHDRRFGNARLRNQTESVDALSLNLDLDKKFGERFALYYGAEAVYNQVGSAANRVDVFTGEETGTNTRYPDGSTWQAYGLYGNLKWKFAPSFTLNTGARYSMYRIAADFDTSAFPFPFVHAENNKGALNGNIGLVFSPDNRFQAYVNASTGFRAPNIDDIGKVFESEPGSVVVPNADLQPEYAYSGEVGVAKAFGNFLKLDVSAFYTYLDNALARRNFQYNGQDSILYDGTMSQVQAIQNITKAYVFGVQAGLDVNFGKGFGLRSTISFQQGKEQSQDSLVYYPLTHAAPLFGRTAVFYQRKALRFEAYAVYNARMDYEDLSLGDRNDDAPFAKGASGLPFVPAWYTLNFKAAWFINRHLVLNAGVENIMDVRYRPFGSGISAPGRNFIVALRFKW